MTQRVIIPSAHVNAIGLVQSLRSIDYEGPIVCLQHKPKQSPIAARFDRLCDVRLITEPESARLPDQLQDWYPQEKMTVLFTDERYLAQFAGDERFNTCKNAGKYLDTVQNKKAFYDFLDEKELANTPKSVSSNVDPWVEFQRPFRSRVWQSWKAGQRLPRGRLIKSKEALEQWKLDAMAAELTEDDWGYQVQLSGEPYDNISVCGWHDAAVHQSIVTRRLAVSAGLGWLVERMADPAELDEAARRILESLNFEGPFELEFVLDPEENIYKVIELNPRFWMQHRLLQALTKHALVRRAIGMKAMDTIRQGGPRFWVQTDVALTRPVIAARHLRQGVLSHPVHGSVPALIRRKLRQYRS